MTQAEERAATRRALRRVAAAVAERDVLIRRAKAEGWSLREIGDELGLAPSTVQRVLLRD